MSRTTITCLDCGLVMENAHNRRLRCDPCAAAKRKERHSGPEYRAAQRARNKTVKGSESMWRRQLKYRWNLTPERYEEILTSQGGVCAICGTASTVRRLDVDHDHSCCPGKRRSCGKCVRGLLCRACNYRLLGQVAREAEIGTENAILVLKRAIAYLERSA